jgi:hypothetical protein
MGPGMDITRGTFDSLSTDDKLRVLYDLVCSMDKQIEQLAMCMKRGYISPWQIKIMLGLTGAVASLAAVIITKLLPLVNL